jgi:hypothetical protein
MTFTGLLDAWDRTDALGRRELLFTLFADLDVRAGKIWRCQPQPETATELWSHLKGSTIRRVQKPVYWE